MPVAEKMSGFMQRSSWIRAMFEAGAKLKAQYGEDNVFDFSLGNPVPPPPERFYEVMADLSADRTPGVHGYMPNPGYPAVRQTIAEHINKNTGLKLGADEIIMTVGAAGAANIILKAILNPGDEIVVPQPYFVEYDFYADNHGGVIKRVPCGQEFGLDVDAIADAITERTAAVMINTPNNPTGAIYSEEQLKDLAGALLKAGERVGRIIYLISDEPYKEVVYDGAKVPDLLPIYPHSLIAYSYSKSLSLAGERIGYVAINPDIADKPELVSAMVMANRILGFVNAPAIMQKAVAQLLNETADMSVYAKKRDIMCKVLSEAGFNFVEPKGAFYIFPKSPIEDDVEFVKAAQEENILVVPGTGFFGPGYFRISFCGMNDEQLARSGDAFKRLRARF
jgi:aspartate aminotransferase